MENNVFLEKFYELLSDRGLTRKAFSLASGIPYPTVIGWTNLNRLPDFYALVKIANFFDCSVDFLTGREPDASQNTSVSAISPIEERLLAKFALLDDEDKSLAVRIVERFSEKK